MKYALTVASTLLFLMAPVAGMGQSTVQTASLNSPLTPQEARSLVKSAHSTMEYQQLAGYFHQQESLYRAKAADEKVELDRRAQVNAGLYQKYPRPVDSAQNLYDSYVNSANGAAVQARHYDALATGEAEHNGQVDAKLQGKS
jgi:hypothetical protein